MIATIAPGASVASTAPGHCWQRMMCTQTCKMVGVPPENTIEIKDASYDVL